MDNIQLCYIDNEINKIDKMKQGDVIYKNGMELLVVLSYDHNEPCKGCFFYKNKACGSEKLIKCWDCKKEYIFTAIRKYNTTELCGIVKRYEETYKIILKTIKKIEKECQKYVIWDTVLDGTLIETLSGDTFPKGIWDMKIKLYVFEAIKNYAPDDILIISNQGGIEKGFVDKEMFEYKFDYISSALEDYTNISVYNFYCDNNDKDNINRKPNTGMIDQYMDYIKFINDNVDEENKIIYDTIMMIGDASGKEGQFSDSDKKTAENFGCEYMDVDDFVYKYNNR